MSGYDQDVLAWSEEQAALLRRVAAGERVDDVDWPNIIEEVGEAGLSSLRACRSLLIQALIHILKARHGRRRGTCHIGARRPGGFASTQPMPLPETCPTTLDELLSLTVRNRP